MSCGAPSLLLPVVLATMPAARAGLFVMILASLLTATLVALALAGLLRRPWQQLRLRHEGGVAFRASVRHTVGHTWLRRLPDGCMQVGVDDVARHLFPRPTRVELPALGAHVDAGKSLATIVSGAREAHITAPVSGTVRTLNRAVLEAPGLVATEPYFRGWLLNVEPDPASVVRRAVEVPGRWLDDELSRMSHLVEVELHAAADDGAATESMDRLRDEQWTRVADAILPPPAAA